MVNVGGVRGLFLNGVVFIILGYLLLMLANTEVIKLSLNNTTYQYILSILLQYSY